MIEIDKKLKSKFKLFGIGFVINIIFTGFLSTYVYSMLSQQEISLASFLPHKMIESMINNQMHILMYFSFLLMALMVIFLIMNSGNSENFASELDEITETIKTPKRVGQSQHGSARWLKESEFDGVFKCYSLTSQNADIKDLVNNGMTDKKEVKNKIEEIRPISEISICEKTTETTIISETK